MEDNPRNYKGQKVLVIGGSEVERAKAIAKLEAEGAIVVVDAEVSSILDGDVLGYHNRKNVEFLLNNICHEPINEFCIKEVIPKKAKSKKNKFQRQPWQ